MQLTHGHTFQKSGITILDAQYRPPLHNVVKIILSYSCIHAFPYVSFRDRYYIACLVNLSIPLDLFVNFKPPPPEPCSDAAPSPLNLILPVLLPCLFPGQSHGGESLRLVDGAWIDGIAVSGEDPPDAAEVFHTAQGSLLQG